MARPPKTRTRSEHLLTLNRVFRSIELDETLSKPARARLLRLLAKLMGELQKGIAP